MQTTLKVVLVLSLVLSLLGAVAPSAAAQEGHDPLCEEYVLLWLPLPWWCPPQFRNLVTTAPSIAVQQAPTNHLRVAAPKKITRPFQHKETTQDASSHDLPRQTNQRAIIR